MGTLGASALGFLAFLLLTPVRQVGGGIVDCVSGVPCPQPATHCSGVLGLQDALGPLSCSPWAAVGAGLLVALLVRAVGRERAR